MDEEMVVQTFGAVCSPYIAQFVKNENARKLEKMYPKGARSIIESMYVDDWFESRPTVEELISLAKEVKTVLSEAKFSLHKWVSNSRSLLASMD